MDWRDRLRENFYKFMQTMTDKLVALFFFIVVGLLVWVLLQLMYLFFHFDFFVWIKSLPYVYDTFSYFFAEISARTPLGIFYFFAFASIFIFPIPLEIFLLTVLKDDPLWLVVLVMTFLGLIVGQHINFWTGKLFGFLIAPLIKKKTRRKIKARLDSYGSFVVFFMNALPLPYPLFNFCVGTLKFPYTKWIIAVLPAEIFWLLLVCWIHLVF